jgi:putative transposase
MARIARVVAPGIPHHITQRGNRRQETFFCAEDYRSSAAAHVAGEDDPLAKAAPRLALVSDWKGFLCAEAPVDDPRLLRRHERSGRPLGREPFVAALEGKLGRTLQRGTPGPKHGGPA